MPSRSIDGRQTSGGEKLGVIASLLETGKICGVDQDAYLADVLIKAVDFDLCVVLLGAPAKKGEAESASAMDWRAESDAMLRALMCAAWEADNFSCARSDRSGLRTVIILPRLAIASVCMRQANGWERARAK